MNHEVINDRLIVTGFVTKTYQNSDGIFHFNVHLNIDENGEYLRAGIPNLYHLDAEYYSTALPVFMEKNRNRKLIKYGLHPADGEIDAEIGIPIEDSKFSKQQLHRTLVTLFLNIEEDYSEIKNALGETVANGENGLPERQRLIHALREHLESQSTLIN